MIYELNKNEYYKIKSLINGIPEINIPLNGIIIGNNGGQVWVDNLDNPKTAIVFAIGCTYYIIGDAENEDFNNSLDSYISDVIGPDCLNIYGGTHFIVTPHEDDWKNKLDIIFKHRNPYKEYRYCYLFNEAKYKNLRSSQYNLPDRYTIKRIDEAMIRNDKENLIIDDILDSFWGSVDKFLDKGFGFSVLKDNKIISNCFSGYVNGNLHEIVIRTYGEENRRKGFATLVASTYIDYCILNKIIPYWSTDEYNIGSIITAEKCGFELYKKFRTYCFPFMKE